jgi:hypothetical protein
MAGQGTDESVHAGTQDHAAEAFEEPGADGLTSAQFAARVAAKREQAAQDAGWIEPPQPDGPVPEHLREPEAEPEGQVEPLQPPEVVEEPEAEGEEPTDEVEGELEEGEIEDEDEEEGDFYLDAGGSRYRTKEEAEDGFREQIKTINRLYRELHERNQAIEQALQEREQGQPQLDEEAWHGWAEEVVASGAGPDGAMAALERGGMDGYNIYLGHWMADEDDRARALTFNNMVMFSYAERRAALQQEAFAEQRSPTEEAQLARQRAAAPYEDFEEYSETMDRLVKQEEGLLPEETRQQLAQMAQSGLEGKRMAWDYLYQAAKAMGAPNRRKAQEAEKKQRRASGNAAKVAAMVSSSEATPTRTPLTEAELIVIRKKNELRERWGQELLPEE